jgi:ADP-heptose:LPS heptosyltransferase
MLPNTPPGAPKIVFRSRTAEMRRRIVRFLTAWALRAVDAALCPPGALPAAGIHRILVCRPNHRLGNAILLSPLLQEIDARFPGAEIDIVSAGTAAATLLAPRFSVRSVLAFPSRTARHPWACLSLMRQLRRNRYDLAIDACPASYSGRLALGACRARYKIGFPLSGQEDDTLQGYLADCPPHMAKRGVHLLRTACAEARATSWPALRVELHPEELERGRRALAALAEGAGGRTGGPVIGIFSNATGIKRYPESWWADFINALRACRPDIRIVNVLAEHGRSQLPGAQAAFYSRNLRKLAAVLAGMDGFISADCGVMHLASAVETPTLGLFILPNQDKYGPYGPGNQAMDAKIEQGGATAAAAALDWIEHAVGGVKTAERYAAA